MGYEHNKAGVAAGDAGSSDPTDNITHEATGVVVTPTTRTFNGKIVHIAVFDVYNYSSNNTTIITGVSELIKISGNYLCTTPDCHRTLPDHRGTVWVTFNLIFTGGVGDIKTHTSGIPFGAGGTAVIEFTYA